MRIVQPFDMRIDRQGRWFHDGVEIRRQALTRLFASVLRCDDQGQHWIETPVERAAVVVQDVPFLITLVHVSDDQLDDVSLETQLGHCWPVTSDMRIEMRRFDDVLVPYVQGPHGLWARFDRQAWYDLADALEDDDDGGMNVRLGSISVPMIMTEGDARTC